MYHLTVTLHLLAAMLWLGGSFSFALVEAPVLRRLEPPALRAQLFRSLGLAFRRVAWVSLAVLLATGVGILHLRGALSREVLGDAAFWQTGFGKALGYKLTLVVLMVGVAILHDFICGPRASRPGPGPGPVAGGGSAARWRLAARWLARLNVVLGVMLIAVAVRLARGG